MGTAPGSTVVTFRVEPNVKEELELNAMKKGLTLSSYLNEIVRQLQPFPKVIANGLREFSKNLGLSKENVLNYMVVDFLARYFVEERYMGESRVNPFYLIGPDRLCKSFEEVYVLLVKEYSEQLLSDPELARKHDKYIMEEQKLRPRKAKPKKSTAKNKISG